jgi:hypothetical protein
MSQTPDFKTRFCQRFECRSDKFEKKLFWQAINPNAKPLAFIMNCIDRDFFYKDFDYIQRLAAASAKREVLAIVNSFPFDPHFGKGFLRGVLRVRISGRRLIEISEQVF